MKNLGHLFVPFFAAFMGFLIARLINNEGFNIVILVAIFILAVFIFNFIIRKRLSFKRYFTSKYNLSTTKVYSEHSYGDVPREIMFEKMIEVVNNSRFKLVDNDKEKLEILAIVNTSMSSWGKNEENLADLLAELEESLII